MGTGATRPPKLPPAWFMHAHAAAGEERDRLWARWDEVETQLDGYADGRSVETPVVVLEPRDGIA